MSREPRYTVEIQVDCTTRDLFLANRVTNISSGGVFIETQLPIHSEVDLRFTLTEPLVTIGAKGRVVWNYDMMQGTARLVTGSGIRFTEMEPAHRELLTRYLEKLRRPQSRAGLAAP
jgi:uncharacterized protein (TIGR02266 family)